MNSRRRFAKLFLQILRISKMIVKLAPFAVENSLGEQTRDRIDVIKPYLNLYFLEGSKQIRLGDANDGGYILDSDLISVDLCLSFGIGDNMRFEEEIANYVDRVFMFDHTIEAPILSKPNMRFFKKGLGIESDSRFFTLEEVVEMALPFNDAVLKIDVEGAEVDVLSNFPSDGLKHFKQIALELHGLHSLGNDVYFSGLVQTLKNLNSNHVLISAHANNWGKFVILDGVPLPDVLELTYIRKTEVNPVESNYTIIDLKPIYMTPNNPLESELILNFFSKIVFVPK